MNHFVIVVNDQPETKESARDIYDKLMVEGVWGFGEKTANRRKIEIGDKVVFYLAGSGGQAFAGTASIASLPEKTGRDENRSDYWFNLTDINTWDKVQPVKDLLDELEFVPRPEVYGVYFQGGSRIISESDYSTIVARGKGSPVQTQSQDTNRAEFVLEKYLEEFIVSNWSKIDLFQGLKIYEDKDGNVGQQYFTGDTGYIDILAVDNKSGDFVVIELKKGKESDKVVGQTLRYMQWVEENLCGNKHKVRGIVIAKKQDKNMAYALKRVNDISVFEYEVDFRLKETSS